MAITIRNLTSGALSLDILIEEGRQIREQIPVGGTVNLEGRVTLDELERNPTIRRLRGIDPVGTPKISVSGDFALKFPDDGAGLVFTAPAVASSTTAMTSATAAGVIRVQIGTATRYINLFSGAPST